MDVSVYTPSMSNYNKQFNIIYTRCETGDKLLSFLKGVKGSCIRPLSSVSSAVEMLFSVLVERAFRSSRMQFQVVSFIGCIS